MFYNYFIKINLIFKLIKLIVSSNNNIIFNKFKSKVKISE